MTKMLYHYLKCKIILARQFFYIDAPIFLVYHCSYKRYLLIGVSFMENSYYNENAKTINCTNLKVDENTTPLKVISLFSGGGGMDLGFRGNFDYLGEHFAKQPYELIFANDIFKQAADVFEYNFGHKVERRSIADLTENDLPTKADVVIGGFPCQDFSVAGKRQGLSSERGRLYQQMIRVIKHTNPKAFIAENVDGIRSSKKATNGKTVDSSALDKILKDFDKAGYNVQYKVLNAADFGVPQSRRRVIIFGLRKDIGTIDNEFYPATQYGSDFQRQLKPWRTSKEGIDDLWNQIDKTSIPNHTSKDVSGAKFYQGRKLQGNNRIKENAPAPTIRAEHHGNIEAHYRTTKEDVEDVSGWRHLSVREVARLQSFPDDFNFKTSASSAYKIIGNAVAPVMAWNIARAVYYSLQKIKQV